MCSSVKVYRALLIFIWIYKMPWGVYNFEGLKPIAKQPKNKMAYKFMWEIQPWRTGREKLF